VEADQVYRAVGTTQLNPTWGLDRSDQRALPLSGSFSYGATGKAVTAYVVDTGLLSSHVEVTGRVAPGYTVIGDGRGTEDCNGHGTHVAGTTGGTTYGIAKGITIVPVRVLGCDGSGSTSGIVTALDWVVSNHAAGTPAVANMSLGGGASSTLDSAVDRVVTDGVTVVVAAGNSGADACASSPARAARALTVGATDNTDAKPSWSNYGTCLDLFAPGVSITSAWYTGSTAANTISGTSMASPHVAGAVAALLESAPTSSPDTVANTLLGAATTGVVTSAGTGSPNRLLHADPTLVPATAPAPSATAPSAPTSVTAKALAGGAAVSWVQGSDGGSALTSQAVKVYAYGRNGKASLVSTATVSGTATTVSVNGLRTGTSYAFTVSATNAAGTSPASALSNRVTAL
jgi:subtilisin family serine protease